MEKLLIVGDLVEDDEFVALCERLDWEVDCLANKHDALGEVRRGDVSTVLLCQCLGDRDTAPLIRQIHAIEPEVDVILVSCGEEGIELPTHTHSSSAAVEALQAGALDYLRQPVSMAQLAFALDCSRTSRLVGRLRSPGSGLGPRPTPRSPSESPRPLDG